MANIVKMIICYLFTIQSRLLTSLKKKAQLENIVGEGENAGENQGLFGKGLLRFKNVYRTLIIRKWKY